MARYNNVIKFEDNSKEVVDTLNDAIRAWLHEAGGEIAGQAARNSRVDSGQLKGSWKYVVKETRNEATIGSPLENAIWEEFGTGEYAVNGDGRKTPWIYQDRKGNYHRTTGKTPNHTLERAFNSKQKAVENQLKKILRGMR